MPHPTHPPLACIPCTVLYFNSFISSLLPLTGIFTCKSLLQHRWSVLQRRVRTFLIHARSSHGACTWCHDQATSSRWTLRTAPVVLCIEMDYVERSFIYIRYGDGIVLIIVSHGNKTWTWFLIKPFPIMLNTVGNCESDRSLDGTFFTDRAPRQH